MNTTRNLLFTLLLFSTTAFAEDGLQWYTVELIVFEHLNPEALQEEQWPDDPGFPSLENAVELSAYSPLLDEEMVGETLGVAPTPHAFVLLHPDEHDLKPVWRRFARLKHYHPLLHIAWRQPGFGKEESLAVHVRSDVFHPGNSIDGVEVEAPAVKRQRDEVIIRTDNKLAAHAMDDTFPVSLPTILPVEGTVRVYRSRYLHVITDLRYFRPVQDDASGGIPESVSTMEEPGLEEGLLEDVQPTLFRLTESRRMRSKELHYLDHPLFGMLVKITPYELPKVEEIPVLSPQETPATITPTEEKQTPSSNPDQETQKPQ